MTYRYFTTDQQIEWLRKEILEYEKFIFDFEIKGRSESISDSCRDEYAALLKKLDELLPKSSYADENEVNKL